MASGGLKEPLVSKPECTDWDEEPAPGPSASFNVNGEAPVVIGGDLEANTEGSDQGLFVALCSLAAAIPALVGSWCWPILVGAIFAVAANNVPGGLIDLFHGLQVAIMLALMTNILQFAWWKCKSKKLAPEADTHWLRFGPCYVLMVATVLVMIQPTCLLVIGSYGTDDTMTPCPTALDPAPEPVSTHHGMSNFFFDADDQSNALVPNTAIGLVIQILGTYLGFGFMFWGVIWSTNLHLKIAKKWNTLRNAARK